MTFVGWVPLRRGIFEHTMLGRLTGNEALVLLCLITLADHKTGSGTTNAAAIRTYLPSLSYDSAKRALCSLEDKHYLFRAIVHRSKRVYPYWINRYEPSDGSHKMLQIDLSEVFESKDIKDINYVTPPPHSALHTSPETAPQSPRRTPLYNNNDKYKDIEQLQPSLLIGECASEGALPSHIDDHRTRIAQRTSAKGNAHVTAHNEASVPADPQEHMVGSTEASTGGVGLRWSGYDGSFVDVDGHTVSSSKVRQLIAPLGLEMLGQGFFDPTTKNTVMWEAALARISGSEPNRIAA